MFQEFDASLYRNQSNPVFTKGWSWKIDSGHRPLLGCPAPARGRVQFWIVLAHVLRDRGGWEKRSCLSDARIVRLLKFE
jgi:hypothetical protein